jgi:hypothetical protein
MRIFLSAIALFTALSSIATAGPKEEANNKPRGATLGDYAAMTLSDTSVVIAGLDTVTGVHDGKPFSDVGRVTFVVAKRGSDWQIVHFHRSAMPN